MSNGVARNPRTLLHQIAHRVMIERGLDPDFSPAALSELSAIRGPATTARPASKDLRGLPWCSIDNDDSQDLDQLSVGEMLPSGGARLLVAIADVGQLVRQGSALDGHAGTNTTSVYTAGGIFPMLPERLSTDLTSLAYASDRASFVVDMSFDKDGAMTGSSIGFALVRNKAKLAYNSVAAWLEGSAGEPDAVTRVPGLGENIRLQHRVAEQLRALRHMRGALSLETVEPRPVFDGDILRDLVPDQSNVAKSLIEELMVASNGVTARYLASRGFPSIRRVVKTPAKWDRIVELASGYGTPLPRDPDGRALEGFLLAAKRSDPEHFPDLSLCVIKLLGRGEYVVDFPGGTAAGHFGLAVADYAHSTAPNRRYPDLLIQRLLASALAGGRPSYSNDELVALARHCSEQENAAKKVERQVAKSAGAILLSTRIGDEFESSVTGVTESGTWVRLFRPAVEGMLLGAPKALKVGDRARVRLVSTDVERGYIDFSPAAGR